MDTYRTRSRKPDGYAKPGVGTAIGLFLFAYAGVSVYFGTPELSSLYRESAIPITAERNPVSFWAIIALIVTGGLVFVVTDVLGYIYGYKKVFKAIHTKPINKSDAKRKST
jgi:hypothetical protein